MQIHPTVDNYRTHKSAEVVRGLQPKKRLRFHLHLTPTRSFWLNQVERGLGLITKRMIRRGTFPRVTEWESAIFQWLASWNNQPKPFVWRATAEVIRDKVRRREELSGTPEVDWMKAPSRH
ncbi:MAG: hypothetical protein WAO35_03890 [Terriglobia bacterium]